MSNKKVELELKNAEIDCSYSCYINGVRVTDLFTRLFDGKSFNADITITISPNPKTAVITTGEGEPKAILDFRKFVDEGEEDEQETKEEDAKE